MRGFFKLRTYSISGRVFGFTLFFLRNRRLQVVLDGKSSQEYPVDAGVLHIFLLLTTFLNDVICNMLSMLKRIISTQSLGKHE